MTDKRTMCALTQFVALADKMLDAGNAYVGCLMVESAMAEANGERQ